jgi:transcriptional regulator GlxA family with amidase domain
MALLAATAVDFGGNANPLAGALPEESRLLLSDEPQLRALSDLIVAEAGTSRCGGGTILARLCEIVVVLAIRKAIAIGTVDAGLLKGLAHSELHPSLVAMHDDPARNWQIEHLAALAGMGRGRFIRIFTETVGTPPGSYLTGWRLTLARVELRAGRSVKSVAARVGFGSAASFSRAFSRKYGYSPKHYSGRHRHKVLADRQGDLSGI